MTQLLAQVDTALRSSPLARTLRRKGVLRSLRPSSSIARDVPFREHLLDIDPGPWLNWWHVGKMIEYTEALVKGEILNLLICAPPRTYKSRITIQGGVSYAYRVDPRCKSKVVCAADALVKYHSRHIRGHVKSCGIPLRLDSRAVDMWETEDGGLFKAETVAALQKGTGWDFGAIDDPFRSRAEALRPIMQRRFWEAYREDFMDRRQPRPDGRPARQLFMHQRLARRDGAGQLLKWLEDRNEEEWTILVLKGYAESKSIVVPSCCTLVPDERAPGEPLCDDEGTMREILLRRKTDPTLHRAQDQQDPPEEESGGKFCGTWFRVLGRPELKREITEDERARLPIVLTNALADAGAIPAPRRWIRSWDFATGGGDLTASALGADTRPRWLWSDFTEDDVPEAQLESHVLRQASRDGKGVEIALPNEPAMGKVFSTRMASVLRKAGYSVCDVAAQREPKKSRSSPHANAASAICATCEKIIVPEDSKQIFKGRVCLCDEPDGEYGLVDILDGPLTQRAIDVLNKFTGDDGGEDDLVDAMAIGYNAGHKGLVIEPIDWGAV